MSIEERAQKWADEYYRQHDSADVEGFGIQDLVLAYLAGSAQTQADYGASREHP